MIDTKRLLPLAVLLLTGATPGLAQAPDGNAGLTDDRGDASAAAPAEEDSSWGKIAGTVALTSDYMFRGISQTDNDPAVQGSLEYSYNTGFYNITPYLGFWGSNVDFNDGGDAHVELDTTFGFRGDLLDTGVSWDLGGIYYAYPGAGRLDGESSNYNYWEIPVRLSYSPIPDLRDRRRLLLLLARFLRRDRPGPLHQRQCQGDAGGAVRQGSTPSWRCSAASAIRTSNMPKTIPTGPSAARSPSRASISPSPIPIPT